MQALLFPDIGLKTLGSNPTGAAFTWPKIVAGDDLRLKLRLIETISGEKVLSRRTISALKLSIGKQDARPTSGSFQLKIGSGSESAGVNTTTSLQFNVSEGDLATALNALTDAALSAKKPFAVVKRDDSYHIRAADSGTVTWVVVDNALLPQSLVDIRPYSFDEGTSYELRLTQTVLCEQTAFDPIVPDLASVSVIQIGAEESGIKRNTIQQIFFPPELSDAYSFRLKWGLRRTVAIGSPADAEAIQAALLAIAETDETVTVTDGEDRVLIEFRGDALSGTSVPALVIEHLVTPAADSVVTVVTATDGLAKYMATIANAATGITEFKLPVSLKLWLVGEQDEEETDPLTFISEVTFQKPVSLDAFSNAAVLNPTRPLSNRSYLPFSPTQVTETQRGYLLTGGTALGDGTATEFQVDHNLGTRHLYVALFGSAVDGQMLKHGTDYEVEIVSDNAVLIIFTTAPASGGVVGGICTVASTNAFVDLEINIGQVIGLEPRLQALEENVAALQALIPTGTAAADTLKVQGGTINLARLESFVQAFPSAVAIQGPDSEALQIESLVDLNPALLPPDGGLLPAVLDAKIEDLTVPLPTEADALRGRVFKHVGASEIDLPGGGGRRSLALQPNEYAACDGRYWYRVSRVAETEVNFYASDFERELFLIAVTPQDLSLRRSIEVRLGFEVAMMTRRGATLAELQRTARQSSRCQWQILFEWGSFALQAAAAGTTVTVVEAANTITATGLENTPDGSPVRFETTGTLPAPLVVGTTYFTRDTSGATRKLAAALGGAAIDLTDIGTGTHTIVPLVASQNLKSVDWSSTPILSNTFQFGRTPLSKSFGVRIKRSLVSSVDTLTAYTLIMGNEAAAAAAPSSASFALRARLVRFDTEDDRIDATGLVVLKGLDHSVIAGEEPGLVTLGSI